MHTDPQHKSHRIDRCGAARRILVVDDNHVTADVIQFYLQRVGFQVTVAHDGSEALAWLDRRCFDLVVTDYRLPGLDGRALCRELRRRDAHARPPVVMVTAGAADLDLSELRRDLELTEILAKPFSPMALVRTIRERLMHPLN
jgi:two-component system response regulator ResD